MNGKIGRQQLDAASTPPIAARLASVVRASPYRPGSTAPRGRLVCSLILHSSRASLSAARIISSDGKPPEYLRQANPVSVTVRESVSISSPLIRIVGDPKNLNAFAAGASLTSIPDTSA